jgi:hypothetical protein
MVAKIIPAQRRGFALYVCFTNPRYAVNGSLGIAVIVTPAVALLAENPNPGVTETRRKAIKKIPRLGLSVV